MEKVHQDIKPRYGRRLLIEMLDEIVSIDPCRPFIYTPRTSNPVDGWEAISFAQITCAIDHVAWQITDSYGRGYRDRFPTLAYIGINDVRYIIIMLACVKAGYTALFLSPRNAKEAQESLLDATGCRIFWHADNFASLVKTWIGDRKIETSVIPSVQRLLRSHARPFPYHRTFDQGRWDPAVALHTSGSTGIPKPVVMKQGSFAICDDLRNLPKMHNGEFIMRAYAERAESVFISMPLFHAAGLMFCLSIALLYETPVYLSIPDRPLTADLAVQCLKNANVQGALLPPVILEELSKSSESMATLARLNYVIFGGGNIGKEAGQALVDNGVILSNAIGSTEYCPYPCHFHTDMENWQYFIFNSEVMGCDWRRFSKEDNTYELILRRNDPKDPVRQAAFYTFPHLDEWSTKDLYKPHRTLPDYWMFSGRVDDVVVFSNGEKLNPVTIEERIVGHPSVKGALVVGQDRFQPALILEPASPCRDEKEANAIVKDVWPLVEKTNMETVTHGRIVKWLIAVAPQDKPFLRTAKGTILRGRTIKLLSKEIDLIYQNQGFNGKDQSVHLDVSSEETLARSIAGLINITDFQDVELDTNFFAVGVDSLKVVNLTRMLWMGLEGAGVRLRPQLIASLIYDNPTAKQLAQSLYSAINHGDITSSIGTDQQTEVLEALLKNYTKNLPSCHTSKPEPAYRDQTVVITGTTGSLGAYLLDRLCTLENVAKIIAINRDQDGGLSRQSAVSRWRGLGTDFSKVKFLAADLSLPEFGLDQVQYKGLLGSVDRVIHNAWPVNFNINVKSFEPQLSGVRHLIDFSAAATKLVPIVFLSTIATAAAWTQKRAVPETSLNDLTLARMGYGQSKLIASLMLDAARKEGIPTASIRIGQIAGPRNSKGGWNRQEYIPSLIASSVYLGALPTHLGSNQVVDWIPTEDVADIVLDVAGVTVEVPTSDVQGYFHAVNPVAVDWSDMVSTVKDHYGDRIHDVITLVEWIDRLESSAREEHDIAKNPGIKLLDTYRSMLKDHQAGQEHVYFSTQRTKARSPTLERLSGITPSIMKNWCEQWKF